MIFVRVVLDSSVFISVFSEKDKFHTRAVKILDQMEKENAEIYIPTLVLPEVCGGITRITQDKVKGTRVKLQLERWVGSGFLNLMDLNKERMITAADFAIDISIKGADAIIASLAKELNAFFVTFDDNLKKKIKDKIKLLEL